MNKIMLIGNLGRDPEMNYTQGGTAITKFTLAVNRVSKGADGERKTETEWFNIIAWNQLAETCSRYLQKGQKVFVEGRLTQRKYTDRNNQERLSVEVIINDMEMLTPKSQGQQSSSGGSSNDFLSGDDDVLGDLDEHPF
jgi:single-strand DNA-binding protein